MLQSDVLGGIIIRLVTAMLHNKLQQTAHGCRIDIAGKLYKTLITNLSIVLDDTVFGLYLYII